jgi:hypothetical protein
VHTGKPVRIDRAWWRARLQRASEKRASILDERTTACRLINGESDGWPGLVLDRYGDVLVLKVYTAAWLSRLVPDSHGSERLTRRKQSEAREFDCDEPLIEMLRASLQPKNRARLSRNVQPISRPPDSAMDRFLRRSCRDRLFFSKREFASKRMRCAAKNRLLPRPAREPARDGILARDGDVERLSFRWLPHVRRAAARP